MRCYRLINIYSLNKVVKALQEIYTTHEHISNGAIHDCTPVISTHGRQRQEDCKPKAGLCNKFYCGLSYIETLPHWPLQTNGGIF